MSSIEKTQIEKDIENLILSAMMARLDPKFEYTADEIIKRYSNEDLEDALEVARVTVSDCVKSCDASEVIGIIYDRVQDNLLLAQQRDERSRIIIPGA